MQGGEEKWHCVRIEDESEDESGDESEDGFEDNIPNIHVAGTIHQTDGPTVVVHFFRYINRGGMAVRLGVEDCFLLLSPPPP